jgi:hypothetical protein
MTDVIVYSVSDVVMNGKLCNVSVTFTMSDGSQDVVINLPLNTSSQPSSSVVFGF